MSYLSEQDISEAARREEEEAVRRMLEKNAGMKSTKTSVDDIDLSTFNEDTFSGPKNTKYKYVIIGIIILLVVIISFAFLFKEKFVKPEEVNTPVETNNNL